MSGFLYFLTQILLSKNLSQSDYGLFISIFILITTFYPLISFGLFDFWIDIYEKEKSYSFRWFKSSVKLILYFIIIFILSLYFFSNVIIDDKKTTNLIMILSFIILGQTMFEIATIRFKLYNSFILYAFWNIIPNTLRLLFLLIYFYFLKKYDVINVSIIYSIISVLIFLIGCFLIKDLYIDLKNDFYKSNINLNKRFKHIKELIISAYPYSLIPFFFLIYYQSDIYIIKYFIGNNEAAIYNVAFLFIGFSFVIPGSLQKIIIKKIHFLFYNDLKNYLKFQIYNAGLMLILGICVMVLTYYLGYFIIKFILDSEYSHSLFILKILIFCIPIHFTAKIFDISLQVSNFIKYKLLIIFFAAVLNLSLNLIFVPNYGAIAAAWTTLLTEFSLLIIFVILFNYNYKRLLK